MATRWRVGRLAILLIVLAVCASSAAESGGGSGAIDEAQYAAGNSIFDVQCSVCHQPTGRGLPPGIPALSGNDNLSDTTFILGTVHGGRNSMPAFPQLGADELAAIALYIRNAWDNAYGDVSRDTVAEFLVEVASEPGTVVTRSVWAGVYTLTEAAEGREVNERHCAQCHGSTLRGGQFGGAPLAGRFFMHKWGDRSLQTLYEYARMNMPPGQAGRLSSREYLRAVAYILEANGFPPGTTTLEVADLPNIIIRSEPSE